MSTYQQTQAELFDLQKYAIKLGLDNIRKLTDNFNRPQSTYPVIHVAGTNGKGSTAFYIYLILRSCGLRVGLFTSPHLKDFRERIRVDDSLIPENAIVEFWQRVRDNVLELKATFFDTTTLMALDWFRARKVDVAVIETGLGGRLDSTNIVKPEIAVLTPIEFDHQKQLGNNLAQIAREKAGIIKPGVTVCVSRQRPNVMDVVSTVTDKNRLYYLPDVFSWEDINQQEAGIDFSLRPKSEESIFRGEPRFFLPTLALYQVENFALSWMVASLFCAKTKKRIDFVSLRKNLETKIWPGRLQMVSSSPLILHDVSHNYQGVFQTVKNLAARYDIAKWNLLLGLVNDKDAEKIIAFLTGKFQRVYVCEPQTSRKQDGEYLVQLFIAGGQKAIFIKDLHEAYEISKESLNMDGGLLVMGSHYLIGAL